MRSPTKKRPLKDRFNLRIDPGLLKWALQNVPKKYNKSLSAYLRDTLTRLRDRSSAK